MTKQEFQTLVNSRVLILDGATGSNLQKRGMPTGICPELWITEHPEVLKQLQNEYIEAGSDIVYAPTFSGNRIKMEEYGLGDRLDEINTKLVRICKENAAGRALVAGDITMTGAQLEPIGDLKFETLVDVYKEQIGILAREGVDLIVIETMMSLQETRAAVIAAKEAAPELPLMATLSFTESGKTLYGAAAASAVVVLQEMGVDAVGMNCSAGPNRLPGVLDQMLAVAKVPVIAKPNAGLPKLDENGQTIYDMGPEEFQKHMRVLVEKGAAVVGGCCGTSPDYIRLLKDIVAEKEGPAVTKNENQAIYLASEREVFAFEENQTLDLGAGIDFSKDEDLVDEYKNGEFDTAVDTAFDLMDDEVDALLFFADIEELDEAEILLEVIPEVTQMVSLPVVVATASLRTVETVLEHYSGILAIQCLAEDEDTKKAIYQAVKSCGAKLVTIDKKIICC